MSTKFSGKQITLYVLGGLGLLIIVTLIYRIVTDRAPKFFPLDDKDATYTIVKISAPYNTTEIDKLPTNTNSTAQGYYHLVYNGKKTELLEGGTFSIIISRSQTNLEPFVNKQVKIEGKFVNSKQQCIVKMCTTFSDGPWVGFEIKNVTLAQ